MNCSLQVLLPDPWQGVPHFAVAANTQCNFVYLHQTDQARVVQVELPNGGQLTHAAIVGQDGGVWAQSAEFPELSQAEADALSRRFSDNSEFAGSTG